MLLKTWDIKNLLFCLIQNWRHKIKGIQSKLHKIGTYVCNISLSCFDDKKYLLHDDINSLAYLFRHESVVYILRKQRQFIYLIIFLQKTNNLCLNLTICQICCSILPRVQVQNVYQVCWIRNCLGD